MRLRVLDVSFDQPAFNIAGDEALLDYCEENGAGFLRFWESPRHFVTLGYTNAHRAEADMDFCAAQCIPILRRCSGGGTVLQGPGCLNYALIAPLDSHPEYSQLDTTNRFVMNTVKNALQPLCEKPLHVAGITDLAAQTHSENAPHTPEYSEKTWRKFSGNAQRRKRRALLFHGTILLHFDLELLSRALKPPPKQPAYRSHRNHRNFVTNFPARPFSPSTQKPASLHQNVKNVLVRAFAGQEEESRVLSEMPPEVVERIEELVAGKYARDDWNLRY